MEQAERDGVSRSQNVIYTLPRSLESLKQVVTSPIERLEPQEGTLQLMILTPDAETALAVSDFAHQLTASEGAEVVPVTSANRAARLIEKRPVHAVAGTPIELQTLVQRSTLKTGSIRTIVLAWADEIVSDGLDGADSLAAMEALFAELPKGAERVLVAHRMTPELETIAERYLWRARRFERVSAEEAESGVKGDESVVETPIQYLTVAATSRALGLQRLLDEIDPPSAVILARTEESENSARSAIQQLGYRRTDDPVQVSREEIPEGVHTIVFFDAPIERDIVARTASVGAVNRIALVTPREIETLRDVAKAITPLTLRGPGIAARRRDRLLRDELTSVLIHGIASRELFSLEPLLEHYDGIEIAAAAVRLLERERQRSQTLAEAVKNAAPRSERPDHSDRGAPPKRGRKFEGDRGDRKFGRGDRKFGGDRKFSRGPDRRFNQERRDEGGD
jgi:ATP-dependent RNA helicase DeaD